MSVYLEGANWRDRILNHYPPASDGERYYKIVAPNGDVIAEAAKLELLNTVLPGNEGTPVNAGNMNSILAAMGHAKKNYSNTMLTEPYLDTLTGYFTFAGSQIVSAVADITGDNTNCTFVDGPHSGQSMGLKGSSTTSGVTLSTKACPMGARTIRFRLYMSANTAQTLLDETNLSASNYGTCITVDSSRKVRFRVMQGGTTVVDITTTTAATLNAWTDVCFAWDGTTGVDRVRAYINGSPAGKSKATTTPNMEQVPTNNTVLLNKAPLANSGGTAAISELEIWNEARYQDALVLEQTGFSLFDGATVRIYPDFLPAAGTEILLNINEQGNVPVEAAALASGQWNQLTYKASSKSFLGTLASIGRLNDKLLEDFFWRGGTLNKSVTLTNGSTTTGSVQCGGSYTSGGYRYNYTSYIGTGLTIKNGRPWPANITWSGSLTTTDIARAHVGEYLVCVMEQYYTEEARYYYNIYGPYVIQSNSTVAKNNNYNYYSIDHLRTQRQSTFSAAVSFDTFRNSAVNSTPADIAAKALKTSAIDFGTISRITTGTYTGTGSKSKTIYVGPDAKLIFIESHNVITGDNSFGGGQINDYISTLTPFCCLTANIYGTLDHYYSDGTTLRGFLCTDYSRTVNCAMSFDPESGNLYLFADTDARYCRNASNVRYDYIIIA